MVVGTLGGELLIVDIDRFEILHELRAHVGQIEAVDWHPTLPYVAGVCGDATISICRYEDGALTLVHSIPQRELKAENDYEFRTDVSSSQAVGFHPTLPRLLSRNHHGAAVEIEFDARGWGLRWCRGYFRREDGVGAKELVFVRYLVGSDKVMLCGRGGVVVVDPERREEPLVRWKYSDRNIHCAEHVEGDDYLLSSDSRRVFRFDASGQRPPVIGPRVVRDDLERISYNKTSGRAFISGFDRVIYEIDPVTCAAIGPAVTTPFKLRYLKTLERAPDTMLIQCRNGSLIKTDLATKRTLAVLKETPNALWSGVCVSPSEMAVAGEGPEVMRIRAVAEDPDTQTTQLDTSWVDLGGARGCYTKRMVLHPASGLLALGRSDGELRVARPDGSGARTLAQLGSPVRDVAAPPEGDDLFAICEDGSCYRVDVQSGDVRARFKTEEEPLWSMAYNHERRLLVAAERETSVYFLDPASLAVRKQVRGPGHSKRMRWLDRDSLLLGFGSYLYRMSMNGGGIELCFPSQLNSVEDFDWTEDRRYFAFCTYHRKLGLVDLQSWKVLHVVVIDMDFPHGVLWLSPRRTRGAYPYEVMAWGRSGVVRRYRVHNDRLVYMGAVNEQFSTPVHDDAGVLVA
jgi:WD40 repeat protein